MVDAEPSRAEFFSGYYVMANAAWNARPVKNAAAVAALHMPTRRTRYSCFPLSMPLDLNFRLTSSVYVVSFASRYSIPALIVGFPRKFSGAIL